MRRLGGSSELESELGEAALLASLHQPAPQSGPGPRSPPHGLRAPPPPPRGTRRGQTARNRHRGRPFLLGGSFGGFIFPKNQEEQGGGVQVLEREGLCRCSPSSSWPGRCCLLILSPHQLHQDPTQAHSSCPASAEGAPGSCPKATSCPCDLAHQVASPSCLPQCAHLTVPSEQRPLSWTLLAALCV